MEDKEINGEDLFSEKDLETDSDNLGTSDDVENEVTEDLETSEETETVEEVEEEETETVEEEVSSDSVFEYSFENPMPVQIVEPVPTDEEIEVFALSGSYAGTISATYLDYFRGIVQKLKPNEHYVVYRSGQNAYTMVYGEEVELNGGRFTGTGSVVNIYRNSSSSNNDWYVDYSSDSLNLSVGTLFVYSDLGMYPTLKEGGSSLEATALLFAVGFAVVYTVCHDIFDYVMQYIYRK